MEVVKYINGNYGDGRIELNSYITLLTVCVHAPVCMCVYTPHPAPPVQNHATDSHSELGLSFSSVTQMFSKGNSYFTSLQFCEF